MAALLRDCFLRLEPWSLQRVQSVKLSVKATSMSVSLQNCFCCLIMLRMQPTQSMILSVKTAPRSRGTAVQNCFERWKTWKLQQLQSLEACFQCVPFAKASVRNCQISFQKDLSLLSMAFQAFRKAVFTQREIDACLANEHCLWRHFHVFRKAPNSSSAAVADPGPNVLLKGLDGHTRPVDCLTGSTLCDLYNILILSGQSNSNIFLLYGGRLVSNDAGIQLGTFLARAESGDHLFVPCALELGGGKFEYDLSNTCDHINPAESRERALFLLAGIGRLLKDDTAGERKWIRTVKNVKEFNIPDLAISFLQHELADLQSEIASQPVDGREDLRCSQGACGMGTTQQNVLLLNYATWDASTSPRVCINSGVGSGGIVMNNTWSTQYSSANHIKKLLGNMDRETVNSKLKSEVLLKGVVYLIEFFGEGEEKPKTARKFIKYYFSTKPFERILCAVSKFETISASDLLPANLNYRFANEHFGFCHTNPNCNCYHKMGRKHATRMPRKCGKQAHESIKGNETDNQDSDSCAQPTASFSKTASFSVDSFLTKDVDNQNSDSCAQSTASFSAMTSFSIDSVFINDTDRQGLAAGPCTEDFLAVPLCGNEKEFEGMQFRNFNDFVLFDSRKLFQNYGFENLPSHEVQKKICNKMLEIQKK